MEQIFQADGAVGVKPFGFALMIKRSNARATIVAVVKLAGITLHTTNAAFIAVVIISLNSVIKEIAHCTKICGELCATPEACLRHGLSVIACIAHHFFHGVPIHFMRLGVIVAVTAHILFVAARRN